MTIDLIIKTLLLVIGFLIFSRMLWPFVQELLLGQKSKNEHDLDAMIQRKIDLMRTSGVGEKTLATSKEENISKPKIDYLDFIKQEFRTLSVLSNKDEIQ